MTTAKVWTTEEISKKVVQILLDLGVPERKIVPGATLDSLNMWGPMLGELFFRLEDDLGITFCFDEGAEVYKVETVSELVNFCEKVILSRGGES